MPLDDPFWHIWENILQAVREAATLFVSSQCGIVVILMVSRSKLSSSTFLMKLSEKVKEH